jgi:hypothetical protein
MGSCLFYSKRGATWPGIGDGPAIAAGDSLTVTSFAYGLGEYQDIGGKDVEQSFSLRA